MEKSLGRGGAGDDYQQQILLLGEPLKAYSRLAAKEHHPGDD
jgi:hypothetical protein